MRRKRALAHGRFLVGIVRSCLRLGRRVKVVIRGIGWLLGVLLAVLLVGVDSICAISRYRQIIAERIVV